MRQTGLTRGNLSSHIGKLEAAGYVEVKKEFISPFSRVSRDFVVFVIQILLPKRGQSPQHARACRALPETAQLTRTLHGGTLRGVNDRSSERQADENCAGARPFRFSET